VPAIVLAMLGLAAMIGAGGRSLAREHAERARVVGAG
jgi:hypothetical protein